MLHEQEAATPAMEIRARLDALRTTGGEVQTTGLPDEIIDRFAADPALQQAVDEALAEHRRLAARFPQLMDANEADQVAAMQAGLVNFYADDAVNPYVAIAARGPWIITSKGRVIHDSGGYGMLGLGHAPPVVLEAMNRPHVMANVMTPSFSQLRLVQALRQEIGHRRAGPCPFRRFVCLNSGSESVTVGLRISDINAKRHTDAGARHAGKPIRWVSLRQGFHGRTDRPAQLSDSTFQTYQEHLASFRDRPGPITIEPNNRAQLQAVFDMAQEQGFFIEALCMEPVMGEGNPGLAIEREFYDLARKLTLEHGALLLVDAIQAGLRTHGVLSIVDYPGFEDCAAPDLETYSKALNAGQYPLSVLALNERTEEIYVKGVYGNTMTTNPRAMDVACAVLDALTPELRANIRERGEELKRKFSALAEELDGAITQVQGTGLLFSCELNRESYRCYGTGSIEEYLRHRGIGVIHGGAHSLRFTPPFTLTSAEVDLIVDAVRDALLNGPRKG